MASTVEMSKVMVDGKRPGDSFSRQGVVYRVVQVRRAVSRSGSWGPLRVVTESRYGREVWF